MTNDRILVRCCFCWVSFFYNNYGIIDTVSAITWFRETHVRLLRSSGKRTNVNVRRLNLITPVILLIKTKTNIDITLVS